MSIKLRQLEQRALSMSIESLTQVPGRTVKSIEELKVGSEAAEPIRGEMVTSSAC